MVFSSLSFLYCFLPLVIILYFLVPAKYKNIILLASSLGFYYFGEPKYIVLMIFSIVSAYIHGILIDKVEEKHKKKILISQILISIGLLVIFKYLDFVIVNINNIFNSKLGTLNLILPIGISFYTFQTISYVVDIYRKDIKPQKSILKLALYISFFPQLIAGPIVRYVDIENQLSNRKKDINKISEGIKRFVIGLSKKVLLANNLLLLCDIFKEQSEHTVIFYWIYAIATSLYIFLDFSGYSDMAIGLAKIFGFDFKENFNYPYISKSITEFWRRWHISLGTWFKDYLYIPLGGNRVSRLKFFRNIFIVWLFTGIWHGASWNFIFWGLYFGTLLVIEKVFLYEKLQKLPSIFSRIYTLLIVVISFVIFSANNLEEAFYQIRCLFGFENLEIINNTTIYYLRSYFIVILISIIASTPLLKLNTFRKIGEKVKYLEPLILIGLLLLSTAYLVDNSFNPFLYFRF